MRLLPHKNDEQDTARARKLRREAAPAEKLLWKYLREEGSARGVAFRRQHPLHPYVADFVCLPAKMVIEVDGWSHDTAQKKDAARDAFLRRAGFEIYRFSDREVLGNAQNIAAHLCETAKQRGTQSC